MNYQLATSKCIARDQDFATLLLSGVFARIGGNNVRPRMSYDKGKGKTQRTSKSNPFSLQQASVSVSKLSKILQRELVTSKNITAARQIAQRSLSSARKVVSELSNSVTVDRDGHLNFRVAPSSLFWGMLAVLALTSASVLLLRSLLSSLFGAHSRFATKQVRDRSLGGRMVTIPKAPGRQLWSERPSKQSMNVLETSVATQFEGQKTPEARRLSGSKFFSSRKQLPSWWPHDEYQRRQSGERSLSSGPPQQHLQEMLNRRVTGADFTAEDIAQLYTLSEGEGAPLKFPSANAAESLFRSAIAACMPTSPSSRTLRLSLGVGDWGPSVPRFLATFSAMLGLPSQKAATMVSAAVAAKTRAGFLQTLALLKQGKEEEAQSEMRAIAMLHFLLPLDAGSAELEMVTHLMRVYHTPEEREMLLELYMSCGLGEERVARESLGFGI